jgi:hypothetical protein
MDHPIYEFGTSIFCGFNLLCIFSLMLLSPFPCHKHTWTSDFLMFPFFWTSFSNCQNWNIWNPKPNCPIFSDLSNLIINNVIDYWLEKSERGEVENDDFSHHVFSFCSVRYLVEIAMVVGLTIATWACILYISGPQWHPHVNFINPFRTCFIDSLSFETKHRRSGHCREHLSMFIMASSSKKVTAAVMDLSLMVTTLARDDKKNTTNPWRRRPKKVGLWFLSLWQHPCMYKYKGLLLAKENKYNPIRTGTVLS